MQKKIVALIPARSGSKIKNKNVKKFKNKPLINWTIDLAIKSKKFNDDVIVSSDSLKILKNSNQIIKIYLL